MVRAVAVKTDRRNGSWLTEDLGSPVEEDWVPAGLVPNGELLPIHPCLKHMAMR
jgi:hypothetical protein